MRIRAHDLLLHRKGGFQLGPLALDVPGGASAAIVGPSGCGKTTLLRCLAGLERPHGGALALGDRIVHEGAELVPAAERGIGFVFQDGALWPHMTALQHVSFADPTLSRAAALELLRKVGLADKAKRRPAKLSGGEGQRLALARALAGSPGLLMLDEPLRSVDVHLRDELGLLIRRIAAERGLTTLIVTHDPAEALAVADHLVVLRDGKVVEAGTASAVLRAPQTAWTASFLCRACCLPTEPYHHEVVTPFGAVARPDGMDGELALVLLPGDVGLGDPSEPAATAPRARVLQSAPGATGTVLTVELQGRSLHVEGDGHVEPGREVVLRLRREPRLLPAEPDVR